MCHPIPVVASQQTPCAAKVMSPRQRQDVAIQALAGCQSITDLAQEHGVSRKFVHRQLNQLRDTLDEALVKPDANEQVLFYLPVTKGWLRQFIVALTLLCHASSRGIIELLRDLLNLDISQGTIHNILQAVATKARGYNDQQDLSQVRIGAHDEIFQSRQPVLVGADVDSSYCYLLSHETHCDGETWGIHLLDLQQRGFAPEAIIGDSGSGLCKGQHLAMPDTPRRGDLFHALRDVETLVNYQYHRAYAAIAARSKLEQRQAQIEYHHGHRDRKLGQRLRQARLAETQGIQLADDVAVLADWLRRDVLAVAGPPFAERCALYDFIVAELRAREHLSERIKAVRTMLQNQRDALLAFARQLDHELSELAQEFAVPVQVVQELLNVQALHPCLPARWQRETRLRNQIRGRFYALSERVEELADTVVRSSSIVENLNGRLRCYFYLRRQLGSAYLALLQFFFNHRRFLRSRIQERVGKSPAELLTGESHPHWLEMLGFKLFRDN